MTRVYQAIVPLMSTDIDYKSLIKAQSEEPCFKDTQPTPTKTNHNTKVKQKVKNRRNNP